MVERDVLLNMTAHTWQVVRDAGAVEGQALPVRFWFVGRAKKVDLDGLKSHFASVGTEAEVDSTMKTFTRRLVLSVTGIAPPFPLSTAALELWVTEMRAVGRRFGFDLDGMAIEFPDPPAA